MIRIAVDCQILVTGYYPILSELSDPFKAMRVLTLYGISRPPFTELGDVDFIEPVVARCTQFFEESTTALGQAIADVGDARVKFVATGFNPQDPVAPMRRPQRDLTFDAGRPIERIVCHRASVGHPNAEGARQIAKQTLSVLGRADLQIT